MTIVVDCGANVDARPEHLVQYAVMARHYARVTLGVAEPTVGVLSIGEEEHKGNRLVKEVLELLRRSPVPSFVGKHFVGNVEGRDVFGDAADVVVCDGFVGNVLLKAAEGLGEMLMEMAKVAIGSSPEGQGLLRQMARKLDYAEYGGAPLLGIQGAFIIGHGRRDARAVANAVRVARDYVAGGVDARIVEDLAAAAAGQA